LQLIRTEDAPRESWVAPEEHIGGERTPASDQFALAALVYECITGEPPVELGEDASRLRPDVPAAMSSAISRALDAQPTRRFASCMDFLSALEANAAKPPAEHRPSGRMSTDALLIDDWEPPEESAEPKRNPIAIGGIAVAIVAIALMMPTLITKFQAARAPQAIVAPPPPVTLPSSPVAAPLPSAEPVTGGIADVTPARAARRRSGENRAPVAPSSIPRVTTAAPAPTTEAPAPAGITAAPAGATASSGVAAAGTGRLSVNANPWGQVFVDDRLIGNTPRANIELPAGTHTLRISRQGFESVTRSVTITAGETLRITDIVLTPVAP
jgi:hypothetical protein